jgi:hypothetical protein
MLQLQPITSQITKVSENGLWRLRHHQRCMDRHVRIGILSQRRGQGAILTILGPAKPLRVT